MATNMHFGDFNPLEVLATAASLQSVASASKSSGGDSESDGTTVGESASGNDSGESDEANQGVSVDSLKNSSTVSIDSETKAKPTSVYRIHIKSLASASAETSVGSSGMGRNTSGSCIVKVVTRNNNNNNNNTLAKGANTATAVCESQNMPTVQDTKRVTVLTEDKNQSDDHSYASIGHLDRSRTEEDEGYISRSSIDSPGQAWRSDIEAQDPDGSDIREGCISLRDIRSPVNVGLPVLTIKSPVSTRPPSVDIASPLSVDSDLSDGLKSPSILTRHSPAALSPAASGVSQQQPPTSILNSPISTSSSLGSKKATKILIISRDAVSDKMMPEEQHGVVEVDGDVDNVIDSADSAQPENVLRSLLGGTKVGTLTEQKSTEISNPNDCSVLLPSAITDDKLDKTEPQDTSCTEAVFEGKDTDIVEVDVCTAPIIPTDVMDFDSTKSSSAHIEETLEPEIAVTISATDKSGDITKEEIVQRDSPLVTVSAGTKTLVVTTDSGISRIVSTTNMSASGPSNSRAHLQTVKPAGKRSTKGKSSMPVAACLPPMNTKPNMNDKMILLPLAGRNQYIIEDDVPPHAKANSAGRSNKSTSMQTLVPVSRIAGVLVADRTLACRTENQDAWEVLSTFNPKGDMTNSSPASHALDTVSIPVAMPAGVSQGLCSKLMATSASGAVLLPCNSVSEPGLKTVLNQRTGGSVIPRTSLQLKDMGSPSSSVVPLKVTAVGLAAQGKSVVMPSPSASMASKDTAISLVDNSASTVGSKDVGPLQPGNAGAHIAANDCGSPGHSQSDETISNTKLITCTPGYHGEKETGADIPISVVQDTIQDSLALQGSSREEPEVRDGVEYDSEKLAGDSSDTESSQTENSDTASALSIDEDFSRSGLESGRVTPIESSLGEKINIKISGSKVINVTGSGEPSSAVKSTTSIGMVGSLSWTSLGSLGSCENPEDDTSTRDSSPLGWNISPPVSAPAMRNLLVSSDTFFPGRPSKHRLLKEGGNNKGEAASARTCHTYVRRRGRASSMPNMTSMADLSRAKQSALLISRLHPLIDHDYCTFAEFSADIQSSIIATTETKIRNERKYAKKAKAARTKAVRSLPPVEKTGRVKRKYVRRKMLNVKKDNVENTTTASVSSPVSSGTPNIIAIREKLVKTEKQTRAEAIKEGKRRAMAERKAKIKAHIMRDKNDKNYVKITGSYQDEFVYFATKKTRGRPRKPVENAEGAQSKTPVCGLIDFDYYRDLSKADKNSRFGISGPRDATGSAAVLSCLANEGFDNLANLKMVPGYTGPSSSPLQDSDVVDLVMDLMPAEELDVTTTCDDNHRMLNSFMSTDQSKAQKVEGAPITGTSESPVIAEDNTSIEPDDLARMVEQVRSMISSMDPEASMKILGKLGDNGKETSPIDIDESTTMKEEPVLSNTDNTESTLNGLNSLLTPCSSEGAEAPSSAPAHPLPGTTNLLDLDDINDSDLIRSDLASMNMILGDLTTTTKSSTTWVDCKSTLSSLGDGSASPMKNYIDSDSDVAKESFVAGANPTESGSAGYSFDRPLDQSELFPDLSSSGETSATVPADSGVPELTVVSMYWNDLPGLLINAQQFVRLVDIHKQILPAKDTGILKKRAQMMGLDISNCSELQRDFLIRYANAAKSKSTVIVSKGAAQTLIGFYVDPRPRAAKSRSVDIKEENEEKDSCGVKTDVVGEESQDSAKMDNITDVKIKEEVEEFTTETEHTSQISPEAIKTDQNLPDSAAEHDTPISVEHRRAQKRSATASIGKGEAVVKQNGNSPRRLNLSRHMLDVKRSARLRNKKVQYAAMLQGNYSDFESTETKARMARTNKRGGDHLQGETTATSDISSQESSALAGGHLGKEDVPRQTYPEEMEIRKLRGKQKKRPLSTKDRKRLKQLRERLRKRMLKSKLLQDEKVKKIAKVKLKEKPMNSDKYQQEHCYAAHPEAKASAAAKPVVTQVKQVLPVFGDNELCIGDVSGEESDAVEVMCEVTLEEDAGDHEGLHSKELAQLVASGLQDQVLEVVHRGSQRGRGQEGLLHLRRLVSHDAAAICCTTCQQFLSLRKFLKHLHHQSNRKELLEVPLPHKLEPLRTMPSLHQQELWAKFDRIRSELNNNKSSPKSVNGSPHSEVKVEDETLKDETGLSTELTGKGRPQVLASPVRRPVKDRCGAVAKVSPQSSTPRAPSVIENITQDDSLIGDEDVNSEMYDDTSPQPGGTRHSTRVRKRKQLHPMESYVFSRGAACVRSDNKRGRHDPEFMVSDAKRRN